MSTTTVISDLEALFKAGAKPTEEDFKKLINAYLVKDDKVGIGTDEPQNNLDVKGKAVIGAGYGGDADAPPNGLLIQGNVGIGQTYADDALHVTGNIRLQTGGLIIGDTQVINEAGVWQGKFPIQDDDNDDDDDQAGSTHWTDENDQVTTTVKVGIGETSPSANLHVRGDVQIDEGQLTVNGLINQKQVAFTAHGYDKVSSLEKGRICFQTTLDQAQQSPAVLIENSIFQPDIDHAGMYFLSVSITLTKISEEPTPEIEEGDERPEEAQEEPVSENTEISLSLDEGQTPLLVMWRSGSCLHTSASLAHHFDGNTSLTLHARSQGEEVEIDIDQIIISGYRL